ncbi:Isoquinoline 1-oxidoreductase subunit beta [Rheinheimera sp. MM224]|nr:Isoquinoline 1-oxidoreductase subunit beta [Rheinheimera sp. MM224]
MRSHDTQSPLGNVKLSRRQFLVSSAAIGASLVIGFSLPGQLINKVNASGQNHFSPNAYLSIGKDGSIAIVVALVEMGQGTYTSIPMMIAEELEVDMSQISVEHAPADEINFGHPLFGKQVTGGSASIMGAWAKLRQVGATAREMLKTAAAKEWGVDVGLVVAEKGSVRNTQNGKVLKYAELVDAANTIPVPTEVKLKVPSEFKLIGTSAARVDTPSKTNGSATFGIDVKLPGMKVAAVALCPVIGGTLQSVDSVAAMKIAGVRQVLQTDEGIAVVADHYGAAKKGLAAVKVTWQEGANATFSNDVWLNQLKKAIQQKGQVGTNQGDFASSWAQAGTKHQASYETPPMAHATMEPLNATLHVRKDGCDVWLGTQAQARVQSFVAKELGLPPESVVVHNHLLGGGFGRKLDVDYVVSAAKFAKQVNYPLKVVWSREEDIQHDAYRPYFLNEVSAVIDSKGYPTAFGHKIAGSAVITRYEPAWLSGIDFDAVGEAESPYDIATKHVEYVRDEPPAGLLTGNWRGVGTTHNSYVTECFFDELAHKAGIDPVQYRAQLLKTNPRLLATLHLAAEKFGWDKTAMPKGTGAGVSVIRSWGSFATLISEVTVSGSVVKVNRMVCAVDCGVAVNPDGVIAQVQGGLIFGLSAALHGTITFQNGRVTQSNFHDYQMVRMNEAPKIEVFIIPSTENPGGMGEVSTAAVAPSVLNAVFAATGKRLRSYPVTAALLV